jgi:hypothetical protein
MAGWHIASASHVHGRTADDGRRRWPGQQRLGCVRRKTPGARWVGVGQNWARSWTGYENFQGNDLGYQGESGLIDNGLW